MLIFFRNLAYGVAIVAGLSTVYTTLGTLNDRLPGGLTLANRPWALSLAIFAAAVVVGLPLAQAHARMDWDFSLVGWLCVGLLFVLARVFEEGARMRDDLEAMI